MSELWVIEAPGKAKTLEAILQRLGISARVQATKGHLLTMPDRLTPLGIDENLHEFLRLPRDIAIVQRLRDEAGAADRLIIATDADQEGDVIAWDVQRACRDLHPEAVRVRLRGMDDESVHEAIATACPVTEADAVPGRTRALVDRLIGSAFSGNGIALGRVGTALLGLVVKHKPSPTLLRLSAPAEDGGRPFRAETPVVPPLTRELAERISALPFPALPVGGARPIKTKPGHTGDVLVRASEVLDISPGEASKAMQRTYEAGRLSYPRSGSAAMSEAATKKINDLIRKAGFKFDSDLVERKTAEQVHDAPHPIGPVALQNDPRRMGHDEGVRTLIARDLVRAGQAHTAETALTSRIERFLLSQGFSTEVSAHIASLDWRRDVGPRFPGQESWSTSQIVERRADAVLLEAAIAAGLGRASTWASHIENFMARGLVDDQLQLTAKGQAWMDASPPPLLDPRLSAAIEKACERAPTNLPGSDQMLSHEARAQWIINALPEGVRQQVQKVFAGAPAQPRVDVIELASQAAANTTTDPSATMSTRRSERPPA